ncbi:MAG: FG-GAP repeat protein [Planctomycetes bacterium]|nr:FG-GAP repeat protein [Planctomycetota bacterium]
MKSLAVAGCLAVVALSGTVRGQSTLYTFLGDAANDEFGWCIDGAGDVNADGWSDIVVGARYADSNGANAGIVRVFSGKTGAILYNWKGAKAYDHLGTSVAGIGDVNADGYADILVGADGTDVNGSGAGSASVYSGKTGTVLSTVSGTAANDIFGTAVAGLGDVDADGRPDYAIGAPWNDNANGVDGGSVRVVSGKNGNLLFTFIGDATSDYFGMTVTGAGDVNKDGRADIAVGAPYGDGPTGSASGYVRVFSGANGTVLYTLRGDSAGDNFGGSVAGAGDVNNDGWVDLIVGAQYDDPTGTSSGSASVMSGKNGAVLHKFVGDAATDLFGSSVSGAGDIDHDGFADVLVGATWDDNTGANAGSMRVFSGFDGQALYTLNGVAAGDQFGYKVASVGDVNKDGTLDFAGTSYLAAQHGTASGFVRVWSPLPEPVVSYCTSKVNSLGCTPTISHTGMPKVSGTAAFTIRATNELAGHNGALFYGFVPQAKPFQGGWLCIEQPLMRTTLLSSGGSGSACNGSYSFDFNNWIRNGGDPALVAGELVCVQYWSRDPGALGTSNTTNALRFVINP